jgi:hypothetical protein
MRTVPAIIFFLPAIMLWRERQDCQERPKDPPEQEFGNY